MNNHSNLNVAKCDNSPILNALWAIDGVLSDFPQIAFGWSIEPPENNLTIEVHFFDEEGNTEVDEFTASYALGDWHAVADTARFVDRLIIARFIRDHENQLAEVCNLTNPVYTLPTFRNKGKVVFTNADGNRVKYTFTRIDLDKLTEQLPPPRTDN